MSELVSVVPAIAKRSRQLRWAKFTDHFPDLGSMTVLDLGGTRSFWDSAPVQPAKLTLVNIDPPGDGVYYRADACDMDYLGIERHDLVFSNSVIGHVGGHYRREQFAEAIHSYGNAHWIQTPYRYFPIDAFMACPGFMSMPTALKAQISLHWPVGTRKADNHYGAVKQVLGIEFLSRTEMQYYFPQSTIITERLAGLPKSLIAVST